MCATNLRHMSPYLIRKAVDQLRDGTSFRDDDELVLMVPGNSIVDFTFRLWGNNPGALAGFKMSLSGTVGFSSLIAEGMIYGDSLNTLSGLTPVTAFDAAVSAAVTAVDFFAELKGTMVSTNTGVMRFRWAQLANDAANPTRLKAGSMLSLLVG